MKNLNRNASIADYWRGIGSARRLAQNYRTLLHVIAGSECDESWPKGGRKEEFCGPKEVPPSAEQLGDFPTPMIGQIWQAQKMLPGKKWVDMEPVSNGRATVSHLNANVTLKYPSGTVANYNYMRFRENGQVHDKIRYRFRCIDRNEAKK